MSECLISLALLRESKIRKLPMYISLTLKPLAERNVGATPVRFFAILSMQRSGSGWFETLLNSHENVSSNGEIFSVKERRSNVSTIINAMDKVYNLDWFTSASKNECSAAVGFKWMLNQGLMTHHKEIVEYFNERSVSAIFLFRRNLLRRMISVLANSYDSQAKLLNGTHKSHVHSPHEAKILANYKPKVNATLLVSNLKEADEMTAKALEYFKSTRHIVLYYEDIVANRTVRFEHETIYFLTIFSYSIPSRDLRNFLQKLADVQEFLRLPYRYLTSRQVKIHSGHLSKQIENWDDVQKALEGTSYESFLHEDYQ
ncbi:Nodulation protein like [Actinidia chinensis var. chinensis]|uniref:Nodulation protein like n=1 Tax=Actinidia chinensis var. chinensis TaxID=1590841 RepID=A0A2R6QXX1_ACTCC|nr:Nodulation protein like [Actinidia chinensis var. chinensis]